MKTCGGCGYALQWCRTPELFMCTKSGKNKRAQDQCDMPSELKKAEKVVFQQIG